MMKTKLLNKLHEIYSITKTFNLNNDKGLGLCGGAIGISLFQFYYEKYFHSENTADKIIEEVMNEISSRIDSYNFSAGLAGIAWTVNHLQKNGFINSEIENIFEDVDNYIFECLKSYVNNGKYDFLHGYLGVGLYFLAQPNSKFFESVISDTISCLFETSEKDNNCYKWLSYSHKSNDKSYNISLSHGSSSIVAYLLKIYKFNKENPMIENLIIGSINYILQQEIDKKKYGSFFPSLSIESEKNNLIGSRLAWCYGDLGIASVLLQAGNILKNNTYRNKALDVLLYAALNRRNLQENMVVDAGLCHGTAGIGHVFYRAWRDTRIPEFKAAADYWFDRTLKMSVFPDGLAGFKAYYPEKYGGLINMYGLLEGISGIGLAMLSYITETEPTWDECLLLS